MVVCWFDTFTVYFQRNYKKKNYIFQNIGFFIILGITSITIFNSIVYYSLYYTQVISGVLMISTIPVWIIFISSILKIEKTNIFQIAGVFLSLTGVIFIITKVDIDLIKNLDFNKGDLTMVIAMFAWALYSALLKKKKYEISQISLLQVVIITGLVFLIPIYIIEMQLGYLINLGTPFYLTLTYVVLFPGLASFFFWIKGISIIGANRAGAFLHLMPIFGAIMAMIIFDEKFMFYHILGAIFIVAGITLSNKKKLMKNTKSKFLNISKKYTYLRKFYLFYNIYIRNYKFLKNGSQFGEDKFILNKFEKNYKGKFLDIGCYHPTKHNNTYLLYKNGWSGINIDLNPLTIELFDFARPNDKNLNIAISNEESVKKLYFIDELNTQNTLDYNHLSFLKDPP